MPASPTFPLAGASGTLGSAILKELLAAGMRVTIFTRTIKEVDYNVDGDLAAALVELDVVILTLGKDSLSNQAAFINAAVAAGVKRFIPSEFGSDTANPKTRQLPIYAHKIQIQDMIVEKAKENTIFSYAWVFNHVFLDWGIQVGFLINTKDRSSTLYDGGNRRFSTTHLSTIGKVVVGVSKSPEATKNRGDYIHNTVVSQNELLQLR